MFIAVYNPGEFEAARTVLKKPLNQRTPYENALIAAYNPLLGCLNLQPGDWRDGPEFNVYQIVQQEFEDFTGDISAFRDHFIQKLKQAALQLIERAYWEPARHGYGKSAHPIELHIQRIREKLENGEYEALLGDGFGFSGVHENLAGREIIEVLNYVASPAGRAAESKEALLTGVRSFVERLAQQRARAKIDHGRKDYENRNVPVIEDRQAEGAYPMQSLIDSLGVTERLKWYLFQNLEQHSLTHLHDMPIRMFLAKLGLFLGDISESMEFKITRLASNKLACTLSSRSDSLRSLEPAAVLLPGGQSTVTGFETLILEIEDETSAHPDDHELAYNPFKYIKVKIAPPFFPGLGAYDEKMREIILARAKEYILPHLERGEYLLAKDISVIRQIVDHSKVKDSKLLDHYFTKQNKPGWERMDVGASDVLTELVLKPGMITADTPLEEVYLLALYDEKYFIALIKNQDARNYFLADETRQRAFCLLYKHYAFKPGESEVSHVCHQWNDEEPLGVFARSMDALKAAVTNPNPDYTGGFEFKLQNRAADTDKKTRVALTTLNQDEWIALVRKPALWVVLKAPEFSGLKGVWEARKAVAIAENLLESSEPGFAKTCKRHLGVLAAMGSGADTRSAAIDFFKAAAKDEHKRVMVIAGLLESTAQQIYNAFQNYPDCIALLEPQQAYEIALLHKALAERVLRYFSRTGGKEPCFSSEQEGRIIAEYPDLFDSFYSKPTTWRESLANSRLGRWWRGEKPTRYRLDAETLAVAVREKEGIVKDSERHVDTTADRVIWSDMELRTQFTALANSGKPEDLALVREAFLRASKAVRREMLAQPGLRERLYAVTVDETGQALYYRLLQAELASRKYRTIDLMKGLLEVYVKEPEWPAFITRGSEDEQREKMQAYRQRLVDMYLDLLAKLPDDEESKKRLVHLYEHKASLPEESRHFFVERLAEHSVIAQRLIASEDFIKILKAAGQEPYRQKFFTHTSAANLLALLQTFAAKEDIKAEIVAKFTEDDAARLNALDDAQLLDALRIHPALIDPINPERFNRFIDQYARAEKSETLLELISQVDLRLWNRLSLAQKHLLLNCCSASSLAGIYLRIPAVRAELKQHKLSLERLCDPSCDPSIGTGTLVQLLQEGDEEVVLQFAVHVSNKRVDLDDALLKTLLNQLFRVKSELAQRLTQLISELYPNQFNQWHAEDGSHKSYFRKICDQPRHAWIVPLLQSSLDSGDIRQFEEWVENYTDPMDPSLANLEHCAPPEVILNILLARLQHLNFRVEEKIRQRGMLDNKVDSITQIELLRMSLAKLYVRDTSFEELIERDPLLLNELLAVDDKALLAEVFIHAPVKIKRQMLQENLHQKLALDRCHKAPYGMEQLGEKRSYDAKFDGILAMKESAEARILINDLFKLSIENVYFRFQLIKYPALAYKLFTHPSLEPENRKLWENPENQDLLTAVVAGHIQARVAPDDEQLKLYTEKCPSCRLIGLLIVFQEARDYFLAGGQRENLEKILKDSNVNELATLMIEQPAFRTEETQHILLANLHLLSLDNLLKLLNDGICKPEILNALKEPNCRVFLDLAERLNTSIDPGYILEQILDLIEMDQAAFAKPFADYLKRKDFAVFNVILDYLKRISVESTMISVGSSEKRQDGILFQKINRMIAVVDDDEQSLRNHFADRMIIELERKLKVRERYFDGFINSLRDIKMDALKRLAETIGLETSEHDGGSLLEEVRRLFKEIRNLLALLAAEDAVEDIKNLQAFLPEVNAFNETVLKKLNLVFDIYRKSPDSHGAVIRGREVVLLSNLIKQSPDNEDIMRETRTFRASLIRKGTIQRNLEDRRKAGAELPESVRNLDIPSRLELLSQAREIFMDLRSEEGADESSDIFCGLFLDFTSGSDRAVFKKFDEIFCQWFLHLTPETQARKLANPLIEKKMAGLFFEAQKRFPDSDPLSLVEALNNHDGFIRRMFSAPEYRDSAQELLTDILSYLVRTFSEPSESGRTQAMILFHQINRMLAVGDDEEQSLRNYFADRLAVELESKLKVREKCFSRVIGLLKSMDREELQQLANSDGLEALPPHIVSFLNEVRKLFTLIKAKEADFAKNLQGFLPEADAFDREVLEKLILIYDVYTKYNDHADIHIGQAVVLLNNLYQSIEQALDNVDNENFRQETQAFRALLIRQGTIEKNLAKQQINEGAELPESVRDSDIPDRLALLSKAREIFMNPRLSDLEEVSDEVFSQWFLRLTPEAQKHELTKPDIAERMARLYFDAQKRFDPSSTLLVTLIQQHQGFLGRVFNAPQYKEEVLDLLSAAYNRLTKNTILVVNPEDGQGMVIEEYVRDTIQELSEEDPNIENDSTDSTIHEYEPDVTRVEAFYASQYLKHFLLNNVDIARKFLEEPVPSSLGHAVAAETLHPYLVLRQIIADPRALKAGDKEDDAPIASAARSRFGAFAPRPPKTSETCRAENPQAGDGQHIGEQKGSSATLITTNRF